MHLVRIELTNFRQHKKLDVDFSGNLIAVLGPNGCLTKGTPVRMFDGTLKPVEEIKSGDVLLAYDDESGRLTSSTVSGMIMTSPNQKRKPILEVTINGEKTSTTYDHPFFAGDGFYPLYQLVWGAMEERQRSQLKLLCEQYGAPFDDATVWQQNSRRDEACGRSAWVLKDHAGWAYREAPSDCGGSMAGESAWSSSCEPYRLQSIEQQGGKSGVVQHKVQCVVWGNPWQHHDSERENSDGRGGEGGSGDLEKGARKTSISPEGSIPEVGSNGNRANENSCDTKHVAEKHPECGVRIEVLEAAPYYTIRMREAPYTYCIGERNCYLTHNCGKSNLIGAIQYALTGEQPGFTKADLTTWGEKDGSVRLIFTAGPRNEEFVLTRKTNGDVVLKVGDETIKQARKVEEALREKAGLDKELIRQIVFVPQKGIDAILFDDPKNREVAFQRLIGIGNASKIYDALRTEIAAYDKPQGFDEAIARSRQQLVEQENVAQTCREALTRYENALKTLPTKEQLEQESAELASASVCVAEYLRVDANLAQTQTRHEEKMKELAGLGAVSEEEEEKLRTRLDDVKDLLKFLQRLKELSDSATKTRMENDLAFRKAEEIFQKHTNNLDDDKEEMERLGAEQVAAESEVRSLRNLEKEASSDGTCPLCGASASEEDIHKHLSERISAAANRASEATEKAKAARMAYDEREAEESAARRELDRKQSAYDIAFGALKDAKDKNVAGVAIDLDTFVVSYKNHATDEIESLTQEQSELTKKLNAAICEKQNAKSVRDAVAKLAAEVDLLVQKKKDCAEKLISLKIDPNTVKDDMQASCEAASKKARANLEAYNGILRDMAAEKGRLESTEKTISDTRTFIADLVSKKEIEGKVKEKVDTLKRVRDWFHYKEGPRIMSQNVMKDLTACVNSYLDQFCAPFVVDAEEEGFGFRCRFIDGRTMPDPHPDASLLSGGQKVALAIAFRMAIYMCFGGELGLLSLDEPTAYLDDASIEHLGELLEKVGAVARNKGLQILMATHEKAIMPFLDTKIDLGALKETQKEE